MTMQMMNDNPAVATLWTRFVELAQRADDERKQNGGSPFAETSLALDDLSAALDRVEAQVLRAAQLKAGGLVPADETAGELVLNGVRFEYARGGQAHREFVKLLRRGVRGLSEAERARLDQQEAAKAMTLANDTTGGVGASPEFAADLLRLSLDYSPVRALAHVVPVGVATGLFLPVRSTVVAAKRVSETGSRAASDDLDVSAANIPAHEAFASFKVSRALLQDSLYPIAQELADAAARSFALLEGTEFVKGTGNGEMKGLNAQTLPSGQVVTTTGTSSTIAAADLFKLVYEAMKEQYLPGATLLLTAKALSGIRQLAATSGNTYLAGGFMTPGRILDLPYRTIPDLDAPGTSGKVVAYVGDFQQAYTVVNRMDVSVQRVEEAFAETGLVEFLVYIRSGGQVVNSDAIARMITG